MGKRLWSFIALCTLAVGMAFAQQTVTGKVVEHGTGEAVVGASVFVDGNTAVGTYTDINGNFTLNNVPSGARLKVSYIGLKSQTVPARAKMRVALEPDAQTTDEVLVVAYGSQKKATFTGAASTIKAEKLENLQVSNISQALEGQVAGVQVVSGSNQPGSVGSIRIRGIGSINANQEPLIVLDGVPYVGSLNSIPTHDIESLTILKDAAANSMYGARGANGVIMVTTKSGKQGKVKIDVDAKYGWNTRGVPTYDIITSPGEYYEMAYEAYRNSLIAEKGYAGASEYAAAHLVTDLLKYNAFLGVADDQLIDPATGKLNPAATQLKWADDWTKDPFETGIRQEYTIGISGGTEDTKAYLSLGYLNDKGYVVGSKFDRFSGRAKVDQNIGQFIRVGGTLGYAHTDRHLFDASESTNYSNMFLFTQSIAPIYPIWLYNNDGTLWLDEKGNPQYDFGTQYGRPEASEQNPVATTRANFNQAIADNINARGYFEANFLKDFTFTANLSYDVINSRSIQFMTPIGGDALNVNGRSTQGTTRGAQLDAIQQLDWRHTFNLHNVHLMVGHETQKYDYRTMAGEMTNFANPDNPYFANAALYQNLNSYRYTTSREGYFFRGNYDYANRYMLNFSLRRDGSSRFSRDNRWGTFWAIGAAWRLHEEPFMKNIKEINDLKLKISYGTQGNDGISPVRAYTDEYSVTRVDGEIGISKSQRGVKDLTWEKSYNFNVGFEGKFLNRINVEFDYFVKTTKDLLYVHPLPPSVGSPSSEYRNEVDMRNKGFEVTLGADIIKTKDFKWSAELNLTHYVNSLTRLPAGKSDDGFARGSYWWKKGGSIYDFYMYKYAGVDPENGDPLYLADVYRNIPGKIITKDEALDLGEGNYTIEQTTVNTTEKATEYELGKSAIPDLTGGISTRLEFKGIDLSIVTAFQIGGYVNDSFYASLMSPSSVGGNMHKDLFDRWTPGHTDTNIPLLYLGSQTQRISGNSDFFITDASYWSLRNVTLGYTLPRSLTDRVGIQRLRIYFTGDNLLFVSKRKGLDPRQDFDGSTGYGYSAMRSYSLGLNLSF